MVLKTAKNPAENFKGKAGPGRPKGLQNKTTALLKDAILKAATDAGEGDMAAYLAKQANLNPGPFMALLGKVLPMQIDGSLTHEAGDTLSSLMERIAANGRRIHSQD